MNIASIIKSAPIPPAVAHKILKARQRKTWSAGDYGRIGTTLQIVGERLIESLDVHAGRTLLDVAGGNGNASLAAARRHCRVTSTDFVPMLLEQGRNRANADGLKLQVREADAELQRVCKPGGRIGLYLFRMIAEAHEGTLEIRSEMGEGTEVAVRLPI